MSNALALIEMPGYRTSGWTRDRHHRRFEVYINGVRVRSFVENAAPDYLIGRWFDEAIQTYIATMERALGCRCMRGRWKNIGENA